MSLWTFLDRNGFGVAIFILIVTSMAAPSRFGRSGSGCRVQCGTDGVSVETTDGGRP